jgi:glycosyltransferase involved in cell wall biosynthesis
MKKILIADVMKDVVDSYLEERALRIKELLDQFNITKDDATKIVDNYNDPDTQYLIAKAMEESDIFLFPSRAEGGARVVTEAMSIGMPVITTYNSGSPINHLVEGIIVNPKDSVAIMEWLVELSCNESLFRNLTLQSRKKIESLVTENSYLETVRKVCNV